MAQTTNAGFAPPADESALALPRLAIPGGGGLALPRPLPPSEAAQLRQIFALQAHGDIPAALREASQFATSEPLSAAMLGHVLADRYLGPYTRPSAEQLRSWLERWPELPDARNIHRLLVVRMPAGEITPALPSFAAIPEHEPAPVPEESADAGNELPRNPDLDRAIREAARLRGSVAVQRLIGRATGLPGGYAAQLRGEAARILFTLNRDADAYDLAAPGSSRAALAGYMAGLAAWRAERIEDARAMFVAAWRADITTPSLQAAAAFWAARTELRLSGTQSALPWLKRAAERRRTFYGLLARRTLGLGAGFSRVGPGEQETLGEADLDAVSALPGGLRAFALLQVDQPDRAAAELRQLWPQAKASRPLARALMLVAEAAGLPDMAVEYADLLAAADGRPREAMRFQVPHLRPANGFSVDPALIYGMARTESNFDATLVSSAGARGLLQIMPDTASFIVGGEGHHGDLTALLYDPAVNLDLGQRYVTYLAGNEAVNGDLMRLLAAYNCGPGSFAHWAPQIRDNGDPLLFIEAIPIDETRAYVPRVLTYTWIYAAQLQLPNPSLEELAAGIWPRYHPRGAAAPVVASLH